MTVRDLKEALIRYDDNMEVMVSGDIRISKIKDLEPCSDMESNKVFCIIHTEEDIISQNYKLRQVYKNMYDNETKEINKTIKSLNKFKNKG